MDDRRRQSKILTQGIGWAVSLAAVSFLVRWINSLESTVWQALGQLDWRWVAVSIVLFLPFFAFRAWAWELISTSAGYRGPRWQNWRMWAISELARYIPGNIWSLAVRYRGARSGGVDRRRSLVSLVIEAAALVGGASLVTALTLPIGNVMIMAALLAAGTLLVLFYGPRLIRRFRPQADVSTYPPALPVYFRYIIAWAFYGAATACLWLAFPQRDGMTWWQAFGLNVAAWIAGYLSFVTPMGLGVREVAFVALLPATVGAAIGGVAAIATRLVMAGTELLFVGLLVLLVRDKKAV